MGELKLIKKHPRAIRWFHWINFPLISFMIWSGILIYWANDVYRVGFGGLTLFHFFPNWFYSFFKIDHRLAEGMAYHFFTMWFFAINGIAYFIYTAVSGEWRFIVPSRGSLQNAFETILHDLRLRKIAPAHGKFNGAQQITYTAIVLMGGLELITGLAIYKPVQVSWLTSLLGGYEWARFEHFWIMLGFCGFFVIHIAQVIRAGWNNFRSMITGYEVEGLDK
jgi:thiosulfate reductase cytochrome b subunit